MAAALRSLTAHTKSVRTYPHAQHTPRGATLPGERTTARTDGCVHYQLSHTRWTCYEYQCRVLRTYHVRRRNHITLTKRKSCYRVGRSCTAVGGCTTIPQVNTPGGAVLPGENGQPLERLCSLPTEPYAMDMLRISISVLTDVPRENKKITLTTRKSWTGKRPKTLSSQA